VEDACDIPISSFFPHPSSTLQLSSNRDFDLDTSLNVDDDLFDNFGGSIKTAQLISFFHYFPNPISNLLNQTLVDSHLESIPGLGSFTTGCLSGGNLEGLGWETNGALDAEFLALGTLNKLLADLLERLDFAGGQGDANLVSFLFRIFRQRKFRRGEAAGDKPGLRRTPFLAFGRTLLRGDFLHDSNVAVTAK
jgi:hypothetical protein